MGSSQVQGHGGLARYTVQRFAQAVPVMLLASIIVFSLLRLIPGDPAVIIAGENASPSEAATIRRELGLTRPLPLQYVSWLAGVAKGNLGTSFTTNRSVGSLIKQAAPATLQLAVSAYALALLLGVPLGIMAGIAPRSVWDYGLSLFSVLGLGIPDFLLGIILLIIFAVKLGTLPGGGIGDFSVDPLDAIRHLILPALALSLTSAAVLARFIRSSVIATMAEDYIRTARAKGLRERTVVLRHALRNSLTSVVTVIGLQVGRLLTGAIVIETVFAWPGIGRLIVNSIQSRDYLVVQSLLLFLVLGFILVNLAVDLAYGLIDPRMRVR